MGATVAATSVPKIVKNPTTSLIENAQQPNSQFNDRTHVANRGRSRCTENRYGQYFHSRFLDVSTWNQIKKEFGPG